MLVSLIHLSSRRALYAPASTTNLEMPESTNNEAYDDLLEKLLEPMNLFCDWASFVVNERSPTEGWDGGLVKAARRRQRRPDMVDV